MGEIQQTGGDGGIESVLFSLLCAEACCSLQDWTSLAGRRGEEEKRIIDEAGRGICLFPLPRTTAPPGSLAAVTMVESGISCQVYTEQILKSFYSFCVFSARHSISFLLWAKAGRASNLFFPGSTGTRMGE